MKNPGIPEIIALKNVRRISMLTCYDFSAAKILSRTGLDLILVGDSLGMSFQGYPDTLAVTLEQMIYHTRAVKKGAPEKLVILDMPFMSYQVSKRQALKNSGHALKESGCDAVKIEGGARSADKIKAIADQDIPVCAHIGMTPQSYKKFGGFRIQRAEEKILDDAMAVEQAGAFCCII
ncbi:MAG TPA: 3-methyl-2-oxobutanoate hydroxymethyltransferase, partial [Spirochaetia bacterium]|nr:3-methyl-2-oxobutanoate hydroxymethyltransferase [Spirochaetia bacterium]